MGGADTEVLPALEAELEELERLDLDGLWAFWPERRRWTLWDAPDGDLAPLEHYWRLGPFLMGGAQISAERYARKHQKAQP